MNNKGVGGRGVASVGIAHVHGVPCCQYGPIVRR